MADRVWILSESASSSTTADDEAPVIKRLLFYQLASDASKPSTGLVPGWLCWADDTMRLYIATSATTWVLLAQSAGAMGVSAIVGDDPPAVAANSLGKVDLTGQSASISSVNLTNGGPVGKYIVFYEMPITAYDTLFGGADVQLSVTHTDIVGAETIYSAPSLFDSISRNTGSFELTVNSGEISYATTVTGSPGTGRYALIMRVVYLG